MTTTAVVLNSSMEPISTEFEIVDDEFGVIELEVVILNKKGFGPCCIQWVRSEDGQSAFWGPKGASLSPHWYSSPGRPTEMSGGRRINVYLDADSAALANRIGSGNVSYGIRIALATAARLPSDAT